MSENGTPDGPNRGEAKEPLVSFSPELLKFWLQWAGYGVMALGGLDIVAALRWRFSMEMPFLIFAGLALMGAGYVLGGKGLSEGYAWPLPMLLVLFVMLVGIFSAALVAMAFLRRMKNPSAFLKQGITAEATAAYALWIGGVFCFALHHILSL